MSARDDVPTARDWLLNYAGDSDWRTQVDRVLAQHRAQVLAERDAANLASAFGLGEGADAFIAEYDARKRAEVLFDVADFFEAAGDIQGRTAASKLREMAVAAHAKGGAR